MAPASGNSTPEDRSRCPRHQRHARSVRPAQPAAILAAGEATTTAVKFFRHRRTFQIQAHALPSPSHHRPLRPPQGQSAPAFAGRRPRPRPAHAADGLGSRKLTTPSALRIRRIVRGRHVGLWIRLWVRPLLWRRGRYGIGGGIGSGICRFIFTNRGQLSRPGPRVLLASDPWTPTRSSLSSWSFSSLAVADSSIGADR